MESYSHIGVYVFLLLGQPDEVDIGAVQIGYAIDKLDDEKVFVIDLSVKVCTEPDNCIFDLPIVDDHKIPIPLCNSNFSLALPGKLKKHTHTHTHTPPSHTPTHNMDTSA